jgi:hypothetical protein
VKSEKITGITDKIVIFLTGAIQHVMTNWPYLLLGNTGNALMGELMWACTDLVMAVHCCKQQKEDCRLFLTFLLLFSFVIFGLR